MLYEIPVASLRGVGRKTTELLASLNIRTLQDLLFHLPLRYEDRTRLTSLGALRHADQTTIEGFIEFTNINYGRRRSLHCCIGDGTGSLILRFYHFNSQQYQQLMKRGLRLRCFGTARQNYQGRLEMVHPEYRVVDATIPIPTEENLTAVYPTTKGLPQAKLRDLLSQALNYLKKPDVLEELFSESLRQEFNLPTLIASLLYVHCPPSNAPLKLLKAGKHPAQQRLIIEELVAQQIELLKLRSRAKMYLAPVLNLEAEKENKLRQALPFKLTAAQERVISEINEDLKRSHPMQRLVQGDVGSGKTIVAAMAIIKVVENGYQCAVMVPTEILAEQHHRAFQKWLNPLGIQVGWLTGSLNNSAREQTLQKIRQGEDQVIVGTHALFQEDVAFLKLGLIVIDEQHRFGVHQRLALKEKGNNNSIYPHQLIMTATPIPRTLALTAYANFDVSTIYELPSGRKPITTVLMSNARRNEVIARIKQNCEQGKQAYWVCTLIEDSEMVQCEAAEATYQKLRQLLNHLTVGLIHGRLSRNEKDAVMMDFKAGGIDLLVATTVVEVGVDVPNASLIIIENAERLGLAQIHQLRGRVGRGKDKSYCVLLYQKPLSQYARDRLILLRNSQDGFVVAQKDLELRGPGELLGTRQAGMLAFRITDLIRDQCLLSRAQSVATRMLEQYPLQATRLLQRWLRNAETYVEV
ncbi:ATP-dependent DNA helicase RecG [Candidatus Coxiella mudrowiae]|uniref:ATP-dependent DNA helicase RecG n=1 Tax=Candidatus Coxiella mudrowiae TaxID=2054173 RepID=A0ABN4HT13_9COXI|nr:ATP-dependent DNA helicase RecG [Candidatus Coxiella mudrowiae]AKQ33865.1 ATP-dependent DNA helicase [Candidatus Coxiella mudrowiae]